MQSVIHGTARSRAVDSWGLAAGAGWATYAELQVHWRRGSAAAELGSSSIRFLEYESKNIRTNRLLIRIFEYSGDSFQP